MKSVDIILTPSNTNYDAKTGTFVMSEVGIQFSMNYKLINPKTGDSREFELSHSTGSEWDPETVWVYKSDDGYTLIITQDTHLTKERSASYLKHKTKDYV